MATEVPAVEVPAVEHEHLPTRATAPEREGEGGKAERGERVKKGGVVRGGGGGGKKMVVMVRQCAENG
jgi:hypothetical protein